MAQACWWKMLTAGVLAVTCFFQTVTSAKAQGNTLSEYQVKALFLYNFAKYIQWPPEVFASAGASITIGIVGNDNFGNDLPNMVNGKTVDGRPFVIKHLSANDDFQGCQILFISNSESGHLEAILGKVGTLPILTVGETDSFLANGGIINFVLKNGNVRLEINLVSSDKARLKISSRLLSVADTVKREGGHP